MTTSLAALCEHYGTDKRPGYHDYAAVYEPLFAPLRGRRGMTLLEIGISAGKSLRVWEEYFPHARIVGVDHEPKTQFDADRIATRVADQANRAELLQAVEPFIPFDVVIDDGGHRMDEQQVSLGVLFPLVKPGGLYIIEDVHTSFPDRHPGYGVEPDGSNSTYRLFDRYARTGSLESRYLTAPERHALEQQIEWASYHFRQGRRHSDLLIFRKVSA